MVDGSRPIVRSYDERMARRVVWNQFGPAAADRIRSVGLDVEVIDVEVQPTDRPRGQAADALFAMPHFGVTDEVRAAADVSWSADVPWIHLGASGLDLFPRSLMNGREVVTSARGSSSAAIAEFVLATMLAHEKSIPSVWSSTADELQLGTLRRQTIGLVGYGTIGQRIAALARAFGADVVATRRSDTSAAADDGTRLATLGEVLAVADHLVLALPATPSTRHLIDDAALARAKPGLHLINIARGSIVDHDALIRALGSGQIGAASLDVTDPEPLPDDHPLRRDPRVRISPHVAWMEPDSTDTLIDSFVNNLIRRCAGEPLAGRVDVELGY